MGGESAADGPGHSRSTLAQGRSPYLDAAVVLGLCSAVTYALAWAYWQAYYGELGIDQSFIDLSPEKALATAWPALLLPLFVVAFAFVFAELDRYEGRLKRPGDFAGRVLLWSLLYASLLVLNLFTGFTSRPAWFYLVLAALLLILWATRGMDVAKVFRSSPHRVFTALVLVLIMLTWFYAQMGVRQARKLREGDARRIRLHLEGRPDLPTEGMLIAHMNGRYFLWGRARREEVMKTYVIDDSIAPSAEILPQGRKAQAEVRRPR